MSLPARAALPLCSQERGQGEEVWRRLRTSTAPMDWQLAHTEALLAGLAAGAPPTIRWYRPVRPALVLGRSQTAALADLAAAREAGVAVYGRTSGGGAVLIERDALSLDVALPAGHPLALGDVTRAYEWIGLVWAEALRQLGITAARVIATEEVRALAPLAADDPLRLACYGTLSPWEVVVGGRKVVGLSQVRRRPGVLYPMGVHLRWCPARLSALLALAPDSRSALTDGLEGAAAGLDELAGHPLTATRVMAAVENALTAQLGITLVPGAWLPQERAAARRLRREQFAPLG